MKVDFYRSGHGKSPIEKFIKSLSKDDQIRFAEMMEGVNKFGLNYPRAKFKPVRTKLWEIKFKGKEGSYRILYTIKNPFMVWLHSFKKKTQKIPKSDLEIAEKRKKEVLNEKTK